MQSAVARLLMHDSEILLLKLPVAPFHGFLSTYAPTSQVRGGKPVGSLRGVLTNRLRKQQNKVSVARKMSFVTNLRLKCHGLFPLTKQEQYEWREGCASEHTPILNGSELSGARSAL